MKIKNKNKLHSSVTILALAVANIFGELYSIDTNAAPTPTPTPRLNYKRTKFTPEEDEKLRELVEVQGTSDWGLIANNIPGRTPRQCRERYLNYLSPDANPAPWAVEEERLLLLLHKQLGNNWALIAKYFPGRTEEKIKNKIKTLELSLIGPKVGSITAINRIYGTNIPLRRQQRPINPTQVPFIPVPPVPNNIQNPPVIASQIGNGNQLIQSRDQVRIFAQPTVTTNINPQQASIIVPDIDPSNINLQTENENQLTQRIVEEEDRTEPLHIHHPNPIPPIDNLINQSPNRRENSIIAPQIENENQFLVRERVDNEIPTFHLLPTIPDMVLQIENRNQLPQIRITEEEQVEPLHIHHPNLIPSIDIVINQLPNMRVEEEDQTLTFNPEFTMPIISRQERPNPLPTFNLLEEPDFYSSNMGSQMRNENQFLERESGVPSFYGLLMPPLQQHRLFDDSSLTNTNDQEEDPIMRSHNNISSRPQRLLDFDDPLAPSNFQPQHRLFDMSLDIDPSSTNVENQEEDSSRRRFPSFFDDDSFSFRPKRFRDSDDFL